MTLKNVGNGLLYQTALIPKMRKVQLACVKGPHLIRENSDPSRLSLSRLERCRRDLSAGNPRPRYRTVRLLVTSTCAFRGFLDRFTCPPFPSYDQALAGQ